MACKCFAPSSLLQQRKKGSNLVTTAVAHEVSSVVKRSPDTCWLVPQHAQEAAAQVPGQDEDLLGQGLVPNAWLWK